MGWAAGRLTVWCRLRNQTRNAWTDIDVQQEQDYAVQIVRGVPLREVIVRSFGSEPAGVLEEMHLSQKGRTKTP